MRLPLMHEFNATNLRSALGIRYSLDDSVGAEFLISTLENDHWAKQAFEFKKQNSELGGETPSGGLTLESMAGVDASLDLGTVETGSYGNNFNGSSDSDGRVDMSFTGTGQNLLLTFDGYDIDFNNEVEVLLNGVSLGYLDVGVNNGLSSY
ncbi:MAG: hypothetical protein P8Y71_12540, partial [Pseudolabrys sp.]